MFEILATICAGIFSGAAVYISVVQHPASTAAGTATAGALFSPMYRRAAPMQGGLAVLGSLAGFASWIGGSGLLWLGGAVLLGFSVPFTLLVIKPVNDQLLSPDFDPLADAAPDLFRRWGSLHLARSATSATAFVFFVFGLAA